jgi:hypothetical protein
MNPDTESQAKSRAGFNPVKGRGPHGALRPQGTQRGTAATKSFLDCGGKRSATPLWKLGPQSKSGVAAALCHRSPKSSRRARVLTDSSAENAKEQQRSADFRSGAFLLESQHPPGRRPALRGSGRMRPVTGETLSGSRSTLVFTPPIFAPIRCCAQDWILPGAWTRGSFNAKTPRRQDLTRPSRNRNGVQPSPAAATCSGRKVGE